MPTVLVLAGPTASGKTALAIDLARHFDAEIISADSRQIYQGMPIGTAAPTKTQQDTIPHHLVAFLNPQTRYSAARFKNDAEAAIRDIHSRGKNAIVVGGTGFYIRALTNDIELAPEQNEQIRDRLAREAKIHDVQFLYEWLQLLDPQRAKMLVPGDTYRIMRALEITLARASQGLPASSRTEDADKRPQLRDRDNLGPSTACPLDTPFGMTLADASGSAWSYIKLILDVPLNELDRRIERRVDEMLEQGLLEEAERIGPTAVAANAVGYPQALAYLAGQCARDELRANLVRATRRYARRQRTWFRSEPNATWVAPEQLETYVMEHLRWQQKPCPMNIRQETATR